MELKDFQKRAVKELLEYTNENEDLVILDAPTGSGKTIILIDYIDKILNDKLVVVWFTPGAGELEEQSENKMKGLTQRVTKGLDDVLLQGFNAGETIFINWERVIKKDNIALKDSEKDNLKDKVTKAHNKGLEFILIIDEEHKNDTKNAKGVLDLFNEKIQIRASATPDNLKGVKVVKVTEDEVIREGLLTKAIYINEGIDKVVTMGDEVEVLIQLAIDKQKEIKKRYDLGKIDVNPMVLIQVPNNDDEIIERVEEYLSEQGYTYENKRVAKWLSEKEDKINITEEELGSKLTDNNAEPIFLIMKQAISTGWDAPRAKILVKLRSNMSETFSIQTIGRIRRMPEGKHYDDRLLDTCFLYTFDNEYVEGVKLSLKDLCNDVRRVKLKDKYKDFSLIKEVKGDSNNILNDNKVYDILKNGFKNLYNLESLDDNKSILEEYGYVFGIHIKRSILTGEIIGEFGKKDLENVDKLDILVKANKNKHKSVLIKHINNIDKEIQIGWKRLNSIFRKIFLRKLKVDDRLLDLSVREYTAFIINNSDKLRDDIKTILDHYVSETGIEIIDDVKEEIFKFPIIDNISYDKSVKGMYEYAKNVYKGYPSTAIRSNVEWLFEKYCEESDAVEWFYKNGEDKYESFSILYKDKKSKTRYFFPDYIVKTKDGRVWIIETKGGENLNKTSKDIDKNTEFKFNYLKEYTKEKGLEFGFVRDQGGRELLINNTTYTEDLKNENWILLKDKISF